MEHRIQGAYTALDMGALYKAYGRVLKTRVSLQNERRQLEMSGVNSVRGACPPTAGLFVLTSDSWIFKGKGGLKRQVRKFGRKTISVIPTLSW
jgi:hypothetical protein